ncbi:MAG TPA: MFS transporter [Solirubrobacterales bacterium]|nr:MFS transporter [Solirubrobacterales bacterium]
MDTGVPRRLFVVASLIIVQDLAFFAAILPLLPEYVREHGLSEAEAGVLTAAYPAGTLLASLPSGFLAARIGPRRTVLIGLMLMGAASFTFGLAESAALLDGARFTQGVAGAMTWAGALTWVIEAEAGGRRGTVIGTLFGIGIAGALLGPPLGALAERVGTEWVFGSVLVLSLVLALVAAGLPEPGARTRESFRDVVAALGRRPVLIASALLAVPSLELGATGVLIPLQLDELGGGAVAIAAGFTIGAAVEASLAPLAGRYTDTHSWSGPYALGLAVSAAALVGIGLAAGLTFAVVAVVGLSVGAGLAFTPATKSVSDSVETAGLHQGMTAGLTNLGWSGGEVAGALVAGAAANGFGLVPAFIGVAATLTLAAGVTWLGRRRASAFSA